MYLCMYVCMYICMYVTDVFKHGPISPESQNKFFTVNPRFEERRGS
jgi:hypothetical protein